MTSNTIFVKKKNSPTRIYTIIAPPLIIPPPLRKSTKIFFTIFRLSFFAFSGIRNNPPPPAKINKFSNGGGGGKCCVNSGMCFFLANPNVTLSNKKIGRKHQKQTKGRVEFSWKNCWDFTPLFLCGKFVFFSNLPKKMSNLFLNKIDCKKFSKCFSMNSAIKIFEMFLQ